MNDSANLYLDLLKKCLGNFIYADDLDMMRGKFAADPNTGRCFSIEPAPVEESAKFYGAIWPTRAHTMIGMPRLNNIQFCAEEVLKAGVRGDFIETGVWRGGAAIFMRGILKAHGIMDRQVWVADSFEGLPPGNFRRYPQESTIEFHKAGDLAVSLDEVKRNFDRYGLLDKQVRFLKGWFRDTLPRAPIKKLAIMRLDGDLYESTMDGLVNLYSKLAPGGFAIIDDYNTVQSCNDAVDDFRKEKQIATALTIIPGGGAFWRKEER